MNWTLPVPERMWFATARLGHNPTGRAPGDTSAFAHWLRDGKLYLNPWSGRPNEYDERLDEAQPGDPVFAYEPGVGIVAVGRIRNPKELVSSGPNLVFPSDGAIVHALTVDWDSSLTRTTGQVHAVTNVGASAFKSCGRGTRFFPMAMELVQEAYHRHVADPDADEAAALKGTSKNLG